MGILRFSSNINNLFFTLLIYPGWIIRTVFISIVWTLLTFFGIYYAIRVNFKLREINQKDDKQKPLIRKIALICFLNPVCFTYYLIWNIIGIDNVEQGEKYSSLVAEILSDILIFTIIIVYWKKLTFITKFFRKSDDSEYVELPIESPVPDKLSESQTLKT